MQEFEVFCLRLTHVIRESGLSRAELATKLGLKPATIKSWCVGRRSPTVRRLLELTELLELDPSTLFEKPPHVPAKMNCPACGQSFRREVGCRIHMALRAREGCADHQRFHGVPVANQ